MVPMPRTKVVAPFGIDEDGFMEAQRVDVDADHVAAAMGGW